MVSLGNDWDGILENEFRKEYYLRLRQILKQEYRTHTIYPSMYDLFNALRLTPCGAVKAVILGQDPYHGAGQAHGLSFSVQRGVPAPPSLQNIFKELQDDLGVVPPRHGCLEAWAKNGVLLLNTVLPVRAGQPNSHRGIGWETFTDAVIQKLNERDQPMVFLLWGANARAKRPLLTNPSHLVLTAAHPSPFSANSGFFGCRHFSKATRFLNQHGITMDWRIPD